MLRIIFAANIVVAGFVGIASLFTPKFAQKSLFSNLAVPGPTMSITGAFWCSLAIISIGGIFYPIRFSAILAMQLVYKLLWLLAFALPAWISGKKVPQGVVIFFILWIFILPFVIPWMILFSKV